MFIKNLQNLKAILGASVEYAAQAGLSDSDLLGSRLAPDMFPLVKQVQIATDNAKGAAARLGAVEPLVLPDDETTVVQLIERIEKVEVYLATFTREQFEGADTRVITLPYFPGKYMTGHNYVTEHALANFFFHVTMSYAILRMVGVPLGKGDYIGGMNMQELS